VGAGKKGRGEAGYIVRVCWLLGQAPSTIGPLTVYFGFLGYLRTGTEVTEFNLVTKPGTELMTEFFGFRVFWFGFWVFQFGF
jgi:hypothetical protein